MMEWIIIEAIIYVGHGSKDEKKNRQLEQKMMRIMKKMEIEIQEVAFLEAAPSLAYKIEQCKKLGATTIIIIPVFLLPGIHVVEDIPSIIEEKKRANPRITFYYGTAFQDAHDLIEDTAVRILQKIDVPKQTQAAVIVSHGSENPQSKEVFERLVRLLEQKVKPMQLFPAYLKSSQPSFEQQLSYVQEKGYAKILVVPHFFDFSKFTSEIRSRLATLQSDRFVYVDPIRYNKAIEKLVKKQITTAKKFN